MKKSKKILICIILILILISILILIVFFYNKYLEGKGYYNVRNIGYDVERKIYNVNDIKYNLKIQKISKGLDPGGLATISTYWLINYDNMNLYEIKHVYWYNEDEKYDTCEIKKLTNDQIQQVKDIKTSDFITENTYNYWKFEYDDRTIYLKNFPFYEWESRNYN